MDPFAGEPEPPISVKLHDGNQMNGVYSCAHSVRFPAGGSPELPAGRGCLSMHCAGPGLTIRTHGDSRSEASGRKRRMNHQLKNSQGHDTEPSFRGRIAASSTPQFETVECGSTVQGQPRSHVAISRHPEERAGSGGDDDPRSQSVPAREDVIRAEARGPAARDQPARRCVHHH